MATKYITLFNLLKAAGDKGISPATCAKELKFPAHSVHTCSAAPYMHFLRTKLGAEIEFIKSGRSIQAYVLRNADVVASNLALAPNSRKATVKAKPAVVAKVAKEKPVKKVTVERTKVIKQAVIKTKKLVAAKVKVKVEREKAVAPDADMHITEFSDGDLADIKAQLGLA